MFIEVKSFSDSILLNAQSGEEKESEDIKFAIYWTDDDKFPVAEFLVDRATFEKHIGDKVDLRNRFTINKQVRRNY